MEGHISAVVQQTCHLGEVELEEGDSCCLLRHKFYSPHIVFIVDMFVKVMRDLTLVTLRKYVLSIYKQKHASISL